MRMNKNPWELLGVQYGASYEEVKKAYKSKALKYHPDRLTGDEDQFKLIQNAYEKIRNQTYVPILTQPDTKLVNIKLGIFQQIHGIHDFIEIPSVGILELRIPAGCRKNDKFKVKHDNKEYIINVLERKEKHFTRHGLNVIMNLDLDIVKAMRGGNIEIETPCGELVEVKIQPGTDSMQQIVIEQHGMYDRRTKKRGNLHVFTQVVIPKIESNEELQNLITRLKYG
jgi:DnaJ-class molecular chaperone